MPDRPVVRFVLPAAVGVLALGLVGGAIGQRDRARREEAAADLAYFEYRALVTQEWEAWDRYRKFTVFREELTSLGDHAAAGGNVDWAAELDREAEKMRLNAEAAREDAEEIAAGVAEMEEAWRAEWARHGLELADRPRW